MISLAVNGACGRMGRRICELAIDEPEFLLAAALGRPGHAKLGQDIGTLIGLRELGVSLKDRLHERLDVLVDFSNPEGTRQRLEECLSLGVSMVIGTTGLQPEHLERIRRASERIPILLAPNMSVGVNVLFKVVAEVARIFGSDCDVEIVEAHHRLKKDSPSGTAMKLAEIVADTFGRNLARDAVYGRKGMTGERRREEIGFHSIRGGDIVGDHTVVFCGLGERLELTHRTHSRDVFARGALRAAKFLHGMTAGLYSFEQALGLQP